LGNPWDHATDVGPVIDARARDGIMAHVEQARKEGRVLKELDLPDEGYFVAPVVLKVAGIAAMEREIFGPVLHVATFKADEIDRVVDEINASGYGLTFGMHTRIDARVEQVTARLKVGNVYVNRNQIGAVVGSQPFGGEGLSGTGPKAGGPHYVKRFCASDAEEEAFQPAKAVEVAAVEARLQALQALPEERLSVIDLPGPTGESNRLTVLGRGVVLCLGPSAQAAMEQVRIARENGCQALSIAPGTRQALGFDGVLPRGALEHMKGFDLVALWSDAEDARSAARALAAREGALIGLVTGRADMAERCRVERHICVDTTAAGGNAQLMAADATVDEAAA